MKNIFIIFLLIVAPSLGFGAEIQWMASKIHGEIIFLQVMSSTKKQPSEMRKYFSSKPDFTTKKTMVLIEAFRIMFDDWINMLDESAYNDSTNPYFDFVSASIQATSLDDLEKRTKSIFKPESRKKFFKILRDFEPIYQKFVWKPLHSQFIQQIEEIKSIYNSKNGNELLDSIGKFYGISDHFPAKLWIGFYPIVANEGNKTALNFGDSQSIALYAGSQNHVEILGDILHEFSHFFFQQRPQNQKDIMNSVFQMDNAYVPLASQYVDEALATACGTGWAVEKINGKLNDDSWYNDPIIEGFARSIYPETKFYLEANQSMNEQFYKNIISTFAKRFPDSIDHLNLGRDVIFFADDEFVSQFLPTLHTVFNYIHTIVGVSPILNLDGNKQKLDETPTSTRIFILTSASLKNAKDFFSSVDELMPYSTKIENMKSPSFQIFRTKKNVPLVLIRAETSNEIQKIITQLKDAKIPK